MNKPSLPRTRTWQLSDTRSQRSIPRAVCVEAATTRRICCFAMVTAAPARTRRVWGWRPCRPTTGTARSACVMASRPDATPQLQPRMCVTAAYRRHPQLQPAMPTTMPMTMAAVTVSGSVHQVAARLGSVHTVVPRPEADCSEDHRPLSLLLYHHPPRLLPPLLPFPVIA